MTKLLVEVLLVTVALALWVGRGIDLGAVNLQAVEVAGAVLILVVLSLTALSMKSSGFARHGKVNLLLYAVIVSCVLLIAAAVLSLTHSIELLAIARFSIRYILGIGLLVALVASLSRGNRISLVNRSLLAGAAASVALSFLGFVIPSVGELTIRYGDRAQGLLNHPNQFAMLLLATIPIALADALRQPKRMLRWLTVCIIAAGVALTGSKLNVALLIVAIAIYSALSTRIPKSMLKRLLLTATVPIMLCVVAVVAYFTVDQFNPRTLVTLERLLTEPAKVSAVVSRSEMWEAAIMIGQEHFWTGVGADHSQYFLPFSHAHNVFIEYFLTLGIGGVMALLALLSSVSALALISIYRATAQKSLPRYDRLLLMAYPLSCFLYIAANQSSDSFGGTTLPIFWFCIALMVAQLLRTNKPRVGLYLRRHTSAIAEPASGIVLPE